MKFSFELSPKDGLHVSTTINPRILQVLTPLTVALLGWPWLTHIAQALGWM